MSVSRLILWFSLSVTLSSCAIDSGSFWSGVPNAVQAEIKVAIQKATNSQVDGIQHNADWPSNEYLVATKDGKYWHAIKWHGRWYVKEAILSVDSDDLTNQWS